MEHVLGERAPGAGAARLGERRRVREVDRVPRNAQVVRPPVEQDVRDSYQRGANSFISKPSTFAGMVEAMRAFRTYWADVVSMPTH